MAEELRRQVAARAPLGLVLALVVAPTVARAAGGPDAVLQPEGWLGTTSQWAQGLGIAFAVIDVILLVLMWRGLGGGDVLPATKQTLFLCVIVLPLAVIFFAYQYAFEASRTVEACGACHVMHPYVNDIRNVKSETLAAAHFKNRYIQEDHCYVCHSDYGMAGTVRAKFDGLGHVWHYTLGTYTLPLKIAKPYPPSRCLYCHGASQKFLNSPGHPKELVADLLRGAAPCVDCHTPVHPTAGAAG